MKPASLLPLLAVWLGAPLLSHAADMKPTAADLDFFERKVRPVFVQHCNSCHNDRKARAGLSLSSRANLLKGGDGGPAVVPGKPDQSLLLRAVRHDPSTRKMPPKGKKLPDAVVADLALWVQRGAAWPAAFTAGQKAGPGDPTIRVSGDISAQDRAFWSFRPVAEQPPPAVKDAAWPRRPLDRFVLAALEAKGLRPVGPAGRRAFVRRATFDLLGLPPTPAEVEAFVTDHRPGAYERLIDRLLASPAYGERWARYWLDVARYAEDQAHTFQARVYPNGWRYRDWVVGAFNADMPYDRFVTAQIAGDLMEGRTPQDAAALGFFGLGPVYYADAGEKKAAEAAELDDRVDTLCRGFLGLTVACARCHDHKFDPIPTKDYYALAGVIRSSNYTLTPLAPAEVVARFRKAEEAVKAQEGQVRKFLDEQAVVLAEGLAGQTAKYMVAAWKLQNRRTKVSKLKATSVARQEKLQPAVVDQWVQYLFRRGNRRRPHLAAWQKALGKLDAGKDLSADPAALAGVTAAARQFQEALEAALAEKKGLAPGKSLPRARAELLRDLFSPQGPFKIDPKQVEKKLEGAARQALAALQARLNELRKTMPPAPPVAHALTEGRAADMRVLVRGNPHKEGDVVPRHFLGVLAGDNPPRFTQGSGRLELAKAIASPANPLTARVMVNRVWQHHFGKGLVGTPSNFGMLGERPTHPALLDHLAHRFVAGGWSVKKIQREILLSATYRLGCTHDEANAATDPGNRLYWRMDRRRLDVEAWRDSLLAATGRLDRTLGGPPSDLNNINNRRRTLYGSVSRHNLSGLLRLFDFPDANLTSDKRPVTIVPLQQLFVINSDFMTERARELARDLAGAAGDDGSRVRLAVRRLYGRPAHDLEVALALEFLGAPEDPAAKARLSRWEQYAQVLLGANEFTFVD